MQDGSSSCAAQLALGFALIPLSETALIPGLCKLTVQAGQLASQSAVTEFLPNCRAQSEWRIALAWPALQDVQLSTAA